MVTSKVNKFLENTVSYASNFLSDDVLDALIMRLIRVSKQREMKK